MICGVLRVPRNWSELTPAWLTEALAPRFPGAVVAAVAVDGVEHGTNSRARLSLEYAAGTGPRVVFVKREGSVLNRLALTALGAREAEADLAAARADLPLPHPELYAAAVDRRRLAAVVLMEDVTERGATPHDATRPLSVDQVRDGLCGLARLHAAYWGRPQTLDFVRPWRLGAVWAPVSWASLLNARRRLRTLGRLELMPDDAAAIERGFRGWAATAATGPQTLLHGDPHPGNTYGLPDGTTGFYDWQLVRSGSWVHDVGYFVASSLTVADRRAHERDLLAGYLADLGPGAPPADEAWDLYRRTPVFGLASWLHTLSGGGFQPVELCLATLERFAAAYADHRP
jgi:aminoglycoside phosphotransferase (APT) family kinase protein